MHSIKPQFQHTIQIAVAGFQLNFHVSRLKGKHTNYYEIYSYNRNSNGNIFSIFLFFFLQACAVVYLSFNILNRKDILIIIIQQLDDDI
jgi:hypothetical protein